MMPSVRHSAAPCSPRVFHCPQILWRFRSGRLSTGDSSSTKWPSPCTAAPSWYWGPGTPSGIWGRRRTRLCRSKSRTPSGRGWQRRRSASPRCRGPTGSPRASLPPPARLDTSVRRMPSGRTPAGTWFLKSSRFAHAQCLNRLIDFFAPPCSLRFTFARLSKRKENREADLLHAP